MKSFYRCVCVFSSGISSLVRGETSVLRCVSLTAALGTDTWSVCLTRTRALTSQSWRDTRPLRPSTTPQTLQHRHCGNTNTQHISFIWLFTSLHPIMRRLCVLQEIPEEHMDSVWTQRIQSWGEKAPAAVRKHEELHHICADQVKHVTSSHHHVIMSHHTAHDRR